MKNRISIGRTYGIVFVIVCGILLAIQLGYSAYYGLIIGLMFTSYIVHHHGYTPREISFMMFQGVRSAWIVLVMMALIGILIGLWMMGGTIPTMMYLGFRYLANLNFLLAAFLITSILSMVLGTSLGTISTVGMALAGIGKGLGIPLPLLVGAIVSGGYLGDRTSPMSSSANLTAVITETKLVDNLRHMMSTTIPVFIICTVFYGITGKAFLMDGPNPSLVALQETLIHHFPVDIILLIPPLTIMLMAIFRFPMVKSLGMGLLTTLVCILFQNQFTFSQIITAGLFGFYPTDPTISSILSGGGLLSMKNVILIIAASTALNGILDGTHMIEPLIHQFVTKIKGVGSLILHTAFLSFMIAVVTCNQTLAVIIPGKFLQKIYEKNQISRNTLARTIADSGIVLVPLIPWNVNGVMITAMFGISVLQFGPYALLAYLLPAFTIIYGYLGILKKPWS
jgi:NhaC family Na+:H+ antiporter